MKAKITHYLILAAIILFGAILRYLNPNWDMGYMLHPDERFLTMVTAAMSFPASFAEYLDPAISKMNPPNIGYAFYVYGVFPLVLNKFLAFWSAADGYPAAGIFGRSLSATFDIITLLVVYKIAVLLQHHLKLKGPFSLLAVFFYAITVEAIQLSHFFTTDIFQTTFMMLTLLFCLYAGIQKKPLFIIPAAITFGLALACKVSAIYMSPVYLILIYLATVPKVDGKHKKGERWFHQYVSSDTVVRSIIYWGFFGLISYLTLRLANPYYFQTPDFFDITPNKLFMANIEQLKGFASREGYFPPSIQWMSKPPVIFSLINLAVIGLGVPYFILVIVGTGVILWRYRTIPMLLLVCFAWGYFLYHSVSFIKVMRYTIFLYPIFAIFAAFAVNRYIHKMRKWHLAGLLGVCMIWPLMVMNIYMQPNSRLEASYWIQQNLPDGSFILSEHWDDGLPLGIPGATKIFQGEQLEVFNPDSPEKFRRIKEQMDKADYYIMSSNRAWGSITTVPDKYPQMAKWYPELFEGKHGYKIIKVITVYPSLEWMGIPLTMKDDWAEESFTVYDHPKVIIMENTAR